MSASKDRSDARAEILRLDAEWSDVAATHDVERILSYWSDDAAVFPPGSPVLLGKAAIRDYITRSFEIPGFQISWRTDDVAVSESGELAYGIGRNRVSFAGPDGAAVTVEGKAVTVWRRDSAGAWKCVVDIWNDAPTSAG